MNPWIASLCLLAAIAAAVIVTPRVAAHVTVERAPTDQGRIPRLRPVWLRHTWLLASLCCAAFAFSLLLTPEQCPSLLWWRLAGPFASRWATESEPLPGTYFWAAILLAAICTHPLRPNLVTAVIATLAAALWLLIGLGLTGIGV